MSPLPTSIRFFLVNGSPEGLRIITKDNWTGCAVVAGRSQLKEALQREELARAGVYVLTATDESDTPRIYIGEADVLRERLKQHGVSKDFWNQLVTFNSSDDNLNKAHVRYIESRLVNLAKKANQWQIENSNTPQETRLSEAERAYAEGFLQEMLLIYPVLGIDAFESANDDVSAIDAPAPTQNVESLLLTLNERGAQAKGHEIAEGFVVLEGSLARANEIKSIDPRTQRLRNDLQERRVLQLDGKHLRFTQDYRFTSPSSAADVLVGGSANGRTAWKDDKGRMLKDLQEARLQSDS
jgi:hypothetical protein